MCQVSSLLAATWQTELTTFHEKQPTLRNLITNPDPNEYPYRGYLRLQTTILWRVLGKKLCTKVPELTLATPLTHFGKMWLNSSCMKPPGVVNKVWLISINTPGKLTRVFLFLSSTVDDGWCRCCSVGPPSFSPSPLNWEGEGERAGSCVNRMITLHIKKRPNTGSNCHCCLYFWLCMGKYVLNLLENNKNNNNIFLNYCFIRIIVPLQKTESN